MSFDVAAAAYGRFMGRFSEPLAAPFMAYAGVRPGDRVLDVGCGPGALTAVLVPVAGSVSAVDPSESFVAAARDRFPAVDVRSGSAEALPFDADGFDATLAQLVVHFMADPVAGLRDMARVTRPGGTVAACVWDHEGGTGPLSLFWDAVHSVDPDVPGEAELAGSRVGHLAELCREAGLREVEDGALTVTRAFDSVEEWWAPFLLGVGPAGAYVSSLDEAGRDRVRDACAALLPPPPFEVSATAWCARGSA